MRHEFEPSHHSSRGQSAQEGTPLSPEADFEKTVCEAATCSDQVAHLVDDFYQEVRSSGRFSWVGLVERIDELDRPRLAVYLLEDPRSVPGRASQPRSIATVFDPLALALHPQLCLDLYFLDGARYSPDDASAYLQQRCAEQPERAAVSGTWALSPAATATR